MYLLLSIFHTIWNNIYYTLWGNVDKSTKNTIGLVAMVIGLVLFVASTKNSKKSQVVSNWFLFWLAMIAVLVSVCYFTI